ncbi:MAG: RHS repeat protein, partial [Kiritimatiellae bacterium]|nr:RHS repeat protein [Kiritimatiellia bacterium]
TISTNGVAARTSSNTYDFRGRISRSIDEQGRVTRYSYSIDNKTTSTTTPSGAINFQVRNIDGSISYNCGSHKPYEIIHYGVDSANGLNWTETYTAATSTNTPILVSKVYENALGEVVRREQVSPNGAFIAEVYTYNNKGQTTSRIIQANTVEAPTEWTTVRPVESYTYDKMGSRISTTLVASSGVSRSTTVETEFFQKEDGAVWKKNTQTVSSSDASIAPITSSFETKLYPLSQTDYAHTISYDERGNATHKQESFNRELSQTTTETYYPTSSTPEVQISALGAILKTISSTSVTNTFTYNTLRERLSSTDGRGNTSSVALDQYGRVTHITDASGATSQFIYDNVGRVITTIDALENQTHIAYDALDRIVAVWGATYTKINAYDIYGRQVALATTRDNSFSLSRNAIPDITQAVAGLDITRWTFDEATGVVLKKIYPDNTETQYSYNSLGQVSEHTWARGVSTTYAYDEFGSMLNKTYSDNTPQVSYTYDALGRCISGTVDGVSTNTFTYNQFGDPISESQNGTIVSRTYDNLGRPIGYSLPGENAYGSSVSYAYDDFGRFSTVSAGTNQFTYSYLQGTPLIASIDSNFGFSRATSYENNRDLISSVNNTFNDATISRYDYTNDALGRRISRNDTIGASQKQNTFGYNVRNEVVSATLGTNEYTYSYDPIGNRTTSTQNAEAKSYISNPLNQYITIQQEEQTAASTYDADGNMLSSPSGWSFTWNAENRLVSASRGGAVVHYTYDAFGRMISKQIIGAENKTITYTWDVFNIIKETENSIATYNIWGLDVDGTMQGAGGVGGLITVAKSGSFYSPTYDANGNITEYVSVNGNVVAQYQYSAFGEIISQSGESFTHRFSTKPYCTTIGLIEYQFRKYDPALGRWLSRDPIEEAGGLNLYAFCENNGIVYYDVLGYNCSIIGNIRELTNWELKEVILHKQCGMSGGNILVEAISLVWVRKAEIECCCRFLGVFSVIKKKEIVEIATKRYSFSAQHEGNYSVIPLLDISKIPPVELPNLTNLNSLVGDLLAKLVSSVIDKTFDFTLYTKEFGSFFKDAKKKTYSKLEKNWIINGDPCNNKQDRYIIK